MRRFHREGYDLVKVVTLDKDVFLALMDEAKKLGLPVAGHIPSILVDLFAGYPIANLDFRQALTLQEVLGSGMASLEHLDELFNMGLARVPSREALPALVSRVRDSGVAVTTLLARVEHTNAMLSAPDAFLSPERIESVRTIRGEDALARARRQLDSMRELDEPTRSVRLSDLPFLFELLRSLVDGGVPILAGTDTGATFLHPGAGLHEELELFVRAGLTPYETLRTATVNPASVLGILEEAGTIEPGKRADLVLVDSSPLERVGALRRPAGVMTHGRWLTREELWPASN